MENPIYCPRLRSGIHPLCTLEISTELYEINIMYKVIHCMKIDLNDLEFHRKLPTTNPNRSNVRECRNFNAFYHGYAFFVYIGKSWTFRNNFTEPVSLQDLIYRCTNMPRLCPLSRKVTTFTLSHIYI